MTTEKSLKLSIHTHTLACKNVPADLCRSQIFGQLSQPQIFCRFCLSKKLWRFISIRRQVLMPYRHSLSLSLLVYSSLLDRAMFYSDLTDFVIHLFHSIWLWIDELMIMINANVIGFGMPTIDDSKERSVIIHSSTNYSLIVFNIIIERNGMRS